MDTLKTTAPNILDRITIDPGVSFGKPCIRGTRIWVSMIMDNLAAGVSEDEILAAFPILKKEDIRSAVAYAAQLTHDRYIPLRLPLEAEGASCV